MTRHLNKVAMASLALALAASAAKAQGVQVSVVGISAKHPTMGNPLYGASVVKGFDAPGHFTIRLGGSLTAGVDNIVARSCGFTGQGPCTTASYRDRAVLGITSLAIEHPVVRWRSLSVLVSAEGGPAFVSTGSEWVNESGNIAGQPTEGRLSASRLLMARMVGTTIRWTMPGGNWALTATGTTGSFAALGPRDESSSYTPFEQAFPMRRLSVGAAINP